MFFGAKKNSDGATVLWFIAFCDAEAISDQLVNSEKFIEPQPPVALLLWVVAYTSCLPW